jgi:hypothetical protein
MPAATVLAPLGGPRSDLVDRQRRLTAGGAPVTASFVPGRQPPQLDEFEAPRLDARDVPVQPCTVDGPPHQVHTALSSAGVSRPETRKVQSAITSVSGSVGLPSRSWLVLGVSGRHVSGVRISGGRTTPIDPSDLKFAVPLATHVVPRRRLHARLTAGLECSCILIVAPAV